MAQFRIAHPYDPNYALPANVMAEAPGRGTLTTVQAPRKSFDNPVPGWDGGYTIPRYVAVEAQGRGAAGTYWDPRKTIPMFVPGQLGLGDDAANALRAYGNRAADVILSSLTELPASQQPIALETLFKTLDPTLLARVTRNLKAGMAPRDAISLAMQEGFGRELVRLGRGHTPTSGLGYYGGDVALSGFWSTITYPFRKVGSATATVASKTYDWGGSVLGKLGSLACGVAGSRVGTAVGGGAAAAFGAPPQVGVVGAQVAGGMCAKPATAVPMMPVSSTPSWVVPAAIGGGALVLVLLLTRK